MLITAIFALFLCFDGLLRKNESGSSLLACIFRGWWEFRRVRVWWRGGVVKVAAVTLLSS